MAEGQLYRVLFCWDIKGTLHYYTAVPRADVYKQLVSDVHRYSEVIEGGALSLLV
jgi:hypothetical protein